MRLTLNSITVGFLAPVFFASLGLEFKFTALNNVPFVVAVLTVAIATKLVAGWWGGRMIGMSHREAVGLGCILNGRGAMELVVAGIAFERGFIGANLFSVLVLVGVVNTLVSPMAFNAVVSRAQRERYRETGVM